MTIERQCKTACSFLLSIRTCTPPREGCFSIFYWCSAVLHEVQLSTCTCSAPQTSKTQVILGGTKCQRNVLRDGGPEPCTARGWTQKSLHARCMRLGLTRKGFNVQENEVRVDLCVLTACPSIMQNFHTSALERIDVRHLTLHDRHDSHWFITSVLLVAIRPTPPWLGVPEWRSASGDGEASTRDQSDGS